MSDIRVANDLMYRLLVQNVKDYAIYLLDRRGVVLNWNAGAERAKGYRADEIVGRSFECFYEEEDRAAGIPARNLERALHEGHLATEGRRVRKDGSSFWASVALDAIYDENGDFIGFAKVTRDLTEQRTAARRLEHQAKHDPLTGLLNRAGVSEVLETQFRELELGSAIAVHFVDLDRFKSVNDRFGHHVGDRVLTEVAQRLQAAVCERGAVGRIGGDEFVVLQFGSPSEEAALGLGRAITDAVAAPFRAGPTLAHIGASVGISMAPRDGRDVDAIFRSADLALYGAKAEGRGRARLFEPALSERALARNLVELKLRQAALNRDFQIVYQPVVDGRSRKPVGYEALLRWTDPTGTAVAPSIFIPLAEELGLMPAIGEWVLREACREAASWPDHLTVAVNLSTTQLRLENLSDLVRQILAETTLPAHRLELEITETAVIDGLGAARRTLAKIRELGVGIALDDFGTGFSSLSLARELPLTRIKIDRSFVADISGRAQSNAIIASVIALCRGFDLHVTAEGVETEEQRAGLIASGCHELQGYLFGRPLPVTSWQALTCHRFGSA